MRVPPSAVINLIRENLRDRYLNDFHIVQELVQNADDAGAVTFEIGWCRRIPSATHPLLQGPGLFAGNDGKFTEKDSEAINCIAISSKTGDKATIGKFGLGLKSVFHLGEVFFCATSARTGIDPGVIVVNPWADANGRRQVSLRLGQSIRSGSGCASRLLIALPESAMVVLPLCAA